MSLVEEDHIPIRLTMRLLMLRLSLGLVIVAPFVFRERFQNTLFGRQVGLEATRKLEEGPAVETLNLGYECWPGDFDCYHQEPLPFPMYPIKPEMLRRSVPSEGSSFLLQEAFRKARITGVFNVVILGGSMTIGHGCISPAGLSGKRCAWGGRLQEWFDERLSDIRVKVMNMAISACALSCHLPHLSQTIPPNMDVDLIIADFAVNDSNLDKFYAGNISGLLVDHEAFINFVLGLGSRPALIYVEGFHANAEENMAEIHMSITERYQVPMVSYRHAIWPDKNDTSDVAQLWGPPIPHHKGNPHPPWQTHQLFADVLIHYLQHEYVDLCSRFGGSTHQIPFLDGVTARAEQTCLTGHLTYMAATGDSPIEPVVEPSSGGDSSNEGGIGWMMGEDVPGKPGLLVYGKESPGASAVFNLSCHIGSSISVGYLGSYEGMGMVEVLIDGKSPNPSGSPYWIDGLWDKQISIQTFNFVPFLTRKGLGGKGKRETIEKENLLLTLKTLKTSDYNGNQTIMTRRGSAKFKLLSLSCC